MEEERRRRRRRKVLEVLKKETLICLFFNFQSDWDYFIFTLKAESPATLITQERVFHLDGNAL